MVLDLPILLRDGVILAILESAWIIAALRYNPRLFLQYYPKEIREAAPPLRPYERMTGRVIGLPFLVLLMAVPIYSTVTFAQRHADADFLACTVHGFGVSMIFNTVDLLVLDLLWLGTLRPNWAMIPGTEHVRVHFNYGHHFRGFAVGTMLSLIVGGIAAAAASGL